jgi:hypothetical protein
MSLYTLCKSGDVKAVHQAIQNGANDWNWGLCGAFQGGHKDLVLLMIQNGADDWDAGLHMACWKGHKDLAFLMMQNGANDWNYALRGACEGGHKDLVLLMIQKGATKIGTYVTYSEHRDLILYLLDHGVPPSQLAGVPQTKQAFQEIETRKKTMMNALESNLIVDVCRLIGQYMIL